MASDRIRLLRIEPDEHAEEPQMIVTFEVAGDFTRFEVGIPVKTVVNDADLVKVARNGLHRIMASAAEESSGWVMSEEDMKGTTAS